ncbi:MAG TPA: hypothetical protein PKB03_08945, partial [Baekduia sp.]|nr:hypothetical protein [Baekduia sp.]
EFARLRQERRTVILVTHEMGSVERFCDRAMLIERGKGIEIGEPRPVSVKYLQTNFERDRDKVGLEHEQAVAVGGDRPVNPGEIRAGDGA